MASLNERRKLQKWAGWTRLGGRNRRETLRKGRSYPECDFSALPTKKRLGYTSHSPFEAQDRAIFPGTMILTTMPMSHLPLSITTWSIPR